MSGKTGEVTLSTKLFYGFGSVAYGVKNNGFSYFLVFFYERVMGLEGYLAGIAMLIVMCVDAVSDPIIGHVSDNLHSKWGRRHPFMYAAAFPVALSYFFVWNPPHDLSQMQLFVYLILLAALVRTFITMYEIPSTALVSEFTDDYDQRTSMLAYRYFFGWWGGLAMHITVLYVLLAATPDYPFGLLNPEGYPYLGIVAAVIIFVAIMVSAIGTHKNIPDLHAPPEKKDFKLGDIFRDLLETLSNRNFLVLFLSAIGFAMAGGISSALSLYFNTFYWGLTSFEIGTIAFVYFASAAIALYIAPRVTKGRDKKTVAITIWLIAIGFMPLVIVLRQLGLMPENGSSLLLPILAAHGLVEIAIIITADILISSMVADVVEDSQKTTGRRSEGLFFAGRTFAGKVVHGFGALAAGIILSVIHFPKGAKPDEIPQEILTNLALIYIPLLMFLYLISVYSLKFYKITRESHADNLAAVSARASSGDTEVIAPQPSD